MIIKKFKISCVVFLGCMIAGTLFGQEKINKTYRDLDRIKLKLVLGDCLITKSNDDHIHVELVYSYHRGDFEPRFRERASSVYLEEKFHDNNPRGYSKWSIAVPDDVEIDFNSATGDLALEGVTVEIDGNTGTGNIDITETKGEFDLNTGTGNIEVIRSEGEFDLNSGTGSLFLEDTKGNFDVNSGTGDVEANNITIEYEGDFSCGTGDVEVSYPNGDGFDLKVTSGTNDAVLDLAGLSTEGYFEFTCHERKGRIISPVKFDDEDEYWEGDELYLRKSFTKGKKNNRYFIHTGTGRAKLIQ